MLAGKKELIEELAKRKGCSKSTAEKQLEEVIDVITDSIIAGGVSIKGMFTIKHKEVSAREGKCAGRVYSSPAKTSLKISVGATLEEKLNIQA